MNTQTLSIQAAVALYVQKVSKASEQNVAENYPNLLGTSLQPKFEYSVGKKYVKVIRKDAASRSVFCFIDGVTGDIYKPAGWAAPAKGIRGNVFDEKAPITSGSLYR